MPNSRLGPLHLLYLIPLTTLWDCCGGGSYPSHVIDEENEAERPKPNTKGYAGSQTKKLWAERRAARIPAARSLGGRGEESLERFR